jgi:hypothetical protein
LAPVRVGERYGFINLSGKLVIPPKFQYADHFAEGAAPVQIDGQFGFVDPSGEIVITPRFQWASQFSQGLAIIKSDGRFGYCDPRGEIVIAAQFDNAFDFSEGLAAVKSDGRYGYIDRSGKFVITPAYDAAGPFQEGLAWTKSNGKYTYLTPQGRDAIKQTYTWADSFTDGVAPVRQSDGATVINRRGINLIADHYDSVYCAAGNGQIYARKAGIAYHGWLDRGNNIKMARISAANGFDVDFQSTPAGAEVYTPYYRDFNRFLRKHGFKSAREITEVSQIEDLLIPRYKVSGTTPMSYPLKVFAEYRVIFVHPEKKSPRIEKCRPPGDHPVSGVFP